MNLKMVKHLIGAEFNIAFESKAKFSSRMLRATFYDVKRLEDKGAQDVA
jgi:hypothetical protein